MKIYLILIALTTSQASSSEHRITIDPTERNKILKQISGGDMEPFWTPSIQLYGISDFYLLLDRVVNYPKNDENMKLSDVAKTFELGSKVTSEKNLLIKKSAYFASISLIFHVDSKKDKAGAKELLNFFDTLIEMSNHDDRMLSKNAHRILVTYCPYIQEKIDYKWFKENFYTMTDSGKILSKYRK